MSTTKWQNIPGSKKFFSFNLIKYVPPLPPRPPEPEDDFPPSFHRKSEVEKVQIPVRATFSAKFEKNVVI